MTAFVTGGNGYIGEQVVRKLIARGYEVKALARSDESAALMEALGAKPVRGDITAIESMRSGMQGCDVVFHIAGWYKLGAKNQQEAEIINVTGTRNVLGLAYELSVPKIVYTSTVTVNGDTQGYLADETYTPPEGSFLTEYDRTKWMAHYRVAVPLIAEGAPIIILMPGVVYGPGDKSLIGDMMRFFYMGLFPILPGPELTLTFAHVEDVAEGHILAAEKGQAGETYIIAGHVATLSEVAQIWAQVSGRRAPLLEVPARYIKPLTPLARFLGTILPMPPILSPDAIAILEATYIARSDKARAQLAWQTRPLYTGMQDTFNWISQTTKPVAIEISSTQRRQLAVVALGAALGLTAAWLIRRRRP
jgi:dihydroflavonol-4-reductase